MSATKASRPMAFHLSLCVAAALRNRCLSARVSMLGFNVELLTYLPIDRLDEWLLP